MRTPEATRRGAGCEPGQVALSPVTGREGGHASLDVLRNQGDQQKDPDGSARQPRRHDRALERRVAREHADAQQDAEQNQREGVDRVHQDQERDHPAGRAPASHASLAQRPVGQRDAPAPPAEKIRVAASPAIVIW